MLARRIGRNELAAIRICRTYVAAQQLYARRRHDGQPAGLYATAFRSDPGRQNGLFWPRARGEKRSPLGDLIANANGEGSVAGSTAITSRSWRLRESKALRSSPGREQDGTGVMSFVVGQDGIVRENRCWDQTPIARPRRYPCATRMRRAPPVHVKMNNETRLHRTASTRRTGLGHRHTPRGTVLGFLTAARKGESELAAVHARRSSRVRLQQCGRTSSTWCSMPGCRRA